MKIYEQEKKDGIEELVLSTACLKYTSPIEAKPEVAKANIGISKDIFGMGSILVSTGWNENDDVFTKAETWKARNTPVNKKFNYMHNEKDIIGHITKSIALDRSGALLADDLSLEDVPEDFDISVESIMYSIWEDPKLQARANQLISEIPDGNWYVSMEVYFANFDYALSKGEENVIIERNEESAFLTKHLKCYGGSGEYEGYRLGRKLNDMFFSGKGLVDNPANKRSLITSFNFIGAKASKTNIFNEVEMSDKHEEAIKNLAVAQEKNESLTSENKALSQTNETLKKDLESAKALNSELKEQNEKLNEGLTAEKENVSKLNKSLAELLENNKLGERVGALVEAGLEKAEATVKAEKFAGSSDEMFGELVETVKQTLKIKAEASVSDATKDLEKSEASSEEDAEAPAQESKPQDEVEDVLKACAEYIGKSLNKESK